MRKIAIIILAVILLMQTMFFTGCDDDSKDENDREDRNESNLGNEESSKCTDHNYSNGICKKCGCSVWDKTKDTSWYSVTETEFTITTAQQLAGFAEIVNNGTDFQGVTVTLAADIDLDNNEWIPIGASAMTPFSGTFNGEDHTIENLSIKENNSDDVGLFGVSEGNINDLGIDSFAIDKHNSQYAVAIGGLTGQNNGTVNNCYAYGSLNITSSKYTRCGILIGGAGNGSTISNSHAKGDINLTSSGESMVGGLAGSIFVGTVSKCYASVDIKVDAFATNYSGGLIGEVSGHGSGYSKVDNCYSWGNVSSYSKNDDDNSATIAVGGLVGCGEWFNISNCYSRGNVESDCSNFTGYYVFAYAGGFLGYITNVGQNMSIKNCYAVGNVSAKGEDNCAGEFIASAFGLSENNCYYSNEQTVSGTNINKFGTPAASKDFLKTEMYRNRLNWDSTVWNFSEGNYPTLK